MSSTNNQVVVAFDFSQSGREALYRAIALATRAPCNILHFVCVVEPHAPIAAVPAKHVDYQYTERVQQALADVVATELNAVKAIDQVHFFVHVRIGKPAAEILALAREVGADLIIVGSRGLTGVGHLLLGSVAEKVVREARCTVEVARAKTYDYVALLDVVDVDASHGYVRPHRYTYGNRSVTLRPLDWPLY